MGADSGSPKDRIKAYVSSTYEDLQTYRLSVIQALRRINVDVVAMEDYGSEGRRPLAKCLEDVGRCDVYIGVFAWKYGYIPAELNPDRKSITELEYRHALSLHKECLVFLLDPAHQWLPAHIDRGEAQERLNSLRDELQTRHTRTLFREPTDLASQVLSAIHNLRERRVQSPDAIVEVVLEGSRKAHHFFRGRRYVIGRSPDCDVVLSDPVVSRAHAECSVDPNALIIRDLESKNGTYVNAERVTLQRLATGDVVRFGVQGPPIRVLLAPGFDDRTIEG